MLGLLPRRAAKDARRGELLPIKALGDRLEDQAAAEDHRAGAVPPEDPKRPTQRFDARHGGDLRNLPWAPADHDPVPYFDGVLPWHPAPARRAAPGWGRVRRILRHRVGVIRTWNRACSRMLTRAGRVERDRGRTGYSADQEGGGGEKRMTDQTPPGASDDTFERERPSPRASWRSRVTRRRHRRHLLYAANQSYVTGRKATNLRNPAWA